MTITASDTFHGENATKLNARLQTKAKQIQLN